MQRKKFGVILLPGWEVGSEKLYCSSYVHKIFHCIRCTYIHTVQSIITMTVQLMYNTTAAPLGVFVLLEL